MKSILMMTNSNPASDPRPNRMIRLLKEKYDITVVGIGPCTLDGVKFIPIQKSKSSFYRKGIKLFQHLLRSYEAVIWPEELKKVANQLASQNFDLIVIHDLSLFPLAFQVKKNAKVLFDAHEYYPRHFEDQFVWRILFQPINKYLCNRYIKKADRMITVSDGIAKEYYKNFGLNSEVMMSLPDPIDLPPSEVNPHRIRMIHHGIVSRSRKIELMIELMDYVDQRFHLDFMFVANPNNPYFKKLQKAAKNSANISFIPPVPFREITRFTNQYDIGLYMIPPTSLNTRYCLPNKLFEFIQARLAVAIGPSVEMKRIVEDYNCGIVGSDFNPRSLAEELNKIDKQQLEYFKKQSDCAARILNSNENASKILEIIESLV